MWICIGSCVVKSWDPIIKYISIHKWGFKKLKNVSKLNPLKSVRLFVEFHPKYYPQCSNPRQLVCRYNFREKIGWYAKELRKTLYNNTCNLYKILKHDPVSESKKFTRHIWAFNFQRQWLLLVIPRSQSFGFLGPQLLTLWVEKLGQPTEPQAFTNLRQHFLFLSKTWLTLGLITATVIILQY